LKRDLWGGGRPDKTDNQIADAIQQLRQCAARFWKDQSTRVNGKMRQMIRRNSMIKHVLRSAVLLSMALSILSNDDASD